MQALALGSLPRLQEGVAVVGYPVGGDTISVTSGNDLRNVPPLCPRLVSALPEVLAVAATSEIK